MTPRMEYYLRVLSQGETITAGIVIFVGGIMTLWTVMSLSPWAPIRRLAGWPFWCAALVLFLVILATLYFLPALAGE
jgi:hypothetical protein